MNKRCRWVDLSEPLYIDYHDTEWGVPSHDDRYLFEMLCLEGAQAGLSWLTILKKRENYRRAYDDFDVRKVASYGEEKIGELLQNPGIVRNKLKIRHFVTNAKAFIRIQEEYGSFDAYIWGFTEGEVIDNQIAASDALPATSDLSDVISKDLKKRGMKFVGSVIIYAYLQAIGIINDHEEDCHKNSADDTPVRG